LTANETAHRIILLNFTSKEAETIANAGYNVERGFIAEGNEIGNHLPYAIPHPVYEYDILFYNSRTTDEVNQEFPNQRNALEERGFTDTMLYFNSPPRVRVSFIGEKTGFASLVQGGTPFIKLRNADANVSALLEAGPNDWQIDELHRTLLNLKPQVSSVGKFFEQGCDTPFWSVVVFQTRNNQHVMGYGTTGAEPRIPDYIVLPQMKDTARAVIQILQCLEELVPKLFPDKRRADWLSDEEFLLPEEKAIHKIIENKIAEAKAFVEAKRKEARILGKQNAFIRALLVAKEDAELPVQQRLSGVVKAALEYLGFEVEDIDAKTKSAIRKEDFWVVDGRFLAITEVSGTGNKNPKVKEFNDILGRMMTLFKRQSDLVLPSGKDIAGLLVLNYDIETHPSRRPRAYIGADAHIVETAAEHNIGILSTVELHKIVMAVKKDMLTKDAARELLKKPGRVDYDASAVTE
jgi:hypothetical protein